MIQKKQGAIKNRDEYDSEYQAKAETKSKKVQTEGCNEKPLCT